MMNSRRRTVLFLLIFSLVTAAVPQRSYPQRERRAGQQQAGPPTQAVPAASPSPSPTPEPTPGPRTATTTTSLGELQTRISEVLRKPELSPAIVAIKIASLDNGRVLFEDNAHKLVRPASNMKLYTVATALDRLTPDYRFVTSVFAAAKP